MLWYTKWIKMVLGITSSVVLYSNLEKTHPFLSDSLVCAHKFVEHLSPTNLLIPRSFSLRTCGSVDPVILDSSWKLMGSPWWGPPTGVQHHGGLEKTRSSSTTLKNASRAVIQIPVGWLKDAYTVVHSFKTPCFASFFPQFLDGYDLGKSHFWTPSNYDIEHRCSKY
jgi:hypothetical protein